MQKCLQRKGSKDQRKPRLKSKIFKAARFTSSEKKCWRGQENSSEKKKLRAGTQDLISYSIGSN